MGKAATRCLTSYFRPDGRRPRRRRRASRRLAVGFTGKSVKTTKRICGGTALPASESPWEPTLPNVHNGVRRHRHEWHPSALCCVDEIDAADGPFSSYLQLEIRTAYVGRPGEDSSRQPLRMIRIEHRGLSGALLPIPLGPFRLSGKTASSACIPCSTPFRSLGDPSQHVRTGKTSRGRRTPDGNSVLQADSPRSMWKWGGRHLVPEETTAIPA